MNSKSFLFFALVLAVIAVPISISAAEVYIWVDDKGVSHASDRPPENSVKIIDQMRSSKDSPEEIERYERQRKLKQYQDDLETARQREINQANEAVEKWRDSRKERGKERREEINERARRNIENLNARKSLQRQYENEATSEERRQYWKNRQVNIDNEIKDNQKILDRK